MTRWHFNYVLLFVFSMYQILSSFNLLMTLTFYSLIQISAGTNWEKTTLHVTKVYQVSETNRISCFMYLGTNNFIKSVFLFITKLCCSKRVRAALIMNPLYIGYGSWLGVFHKLYFSTVETSANFKTFLKVFRHL